MKKPKKKSYIGYTHNDWYKDFFIRLWWTGASWNDSISPPEIYKKKDRLCDKKVKITVEEI